MSGNNVFEHFGVSKRLVPLLSRSPIPSEWINVRSAGVRFAESALQWRPEYGQLHHAAAVAANGNGCAVLNLRRSVSAVDNLRIQFPY